MILTDVVAVSWPLCKCCLLFHLHSSALSGHQRSTPHYSPICLFTFEHQRSAKWCSSLFRSSPRGELPWASCCAYFDVDGGPVGIRAYKEDTIIDISMLEKILFVARYKIWSWLRIDFD
jgi:hypothetical protein